MGFGGDDFHSGTTPSPTIVSQVSETARTSPSSRGRSRAETLSQMTSAGTQYSITLEALDNGHMIGSAHNVLLLV